MRALIVDTNVVSVVFKQRHALSAGFWRLLSDHHLTISFMTRAELLLWPRRNGWGQRRLDLLVNLIAEFTTLYPDDRTCELWGEVRDECRRNGRPIDSADAWIAAAAIQWDVSLVTANVRDFESIDRLRLTPMETEDL